MSDSAFLAESVLSAKAPFQAGASQTSFLNKIFSKLSKQHRETRHSSTLAGTFSESILSYLDELPKTLLRYR